MRRALPGTVIDQIRDGATEQTLRQRGDAAVWDHLVSTAASAMQRDWPYWEWAALVTHPASLLGVQAARRYDMWPPHARPPENRERRLEQAWTAAQEWVTAAAAPTARTNVLQRVTAIAEAAAAADLDPGERAVLDHALVLAARIGTDRPALPRRRVAEATGLGVKAVRCAVSRLVALGWLQLDVPGSPGPRSRRANLYRLRLPGEALVPASDRGALIPPKGKICGPGPYEGPSHDEPGQEHGKEDQGDTFPDNVIPFRPRRIA